MSERSARILRRAGMALAALLLLAVIAAAVLLGTEWGARWTLERFGPEALAVERVEGRLLGPLSLRDVAYETGTAGIAIERVRLEWNPTDLIGGTLHVDTLTLRGLTVRRKEAPETTPAAEDTAAGPRLPRLPVDVRVDRLRVSDVRILPPGADSALAIEEIRLSGSARDGAIRVDTLRVRMPAGGRLALDGAIRDGREAPRFRVRARWEDLEWPPGPGAEYRSPSGELAAEGSLRSYEVTLETRAGGISLPPGRWRLAGRGTASSITLDTIRGRTREGTLRGQAELSWSPYPTWDVAIEADRLNPAVLLPDWPGHLSVDLASRGALPETGPRGRLRIRRLEGELRGRPLEGRAQVELRGDRLRVDTLHLRSGSARLAAGGRLAERWDLSWRISAPELSDLLPRASGSFTAAGALSGTREEPRVTADVSGRRVAFGENRVRTLRGEVELDLAEGRPSAVDLRATGIEVGERRLAALRLEGRGSRSDHRLSLVLRSDTASLEIAASGGLREETWRGRLTRMELEGSGPGIGRWTLRDPPVALRVSAGAARVERLCWASSDAGRVCLSGSWSETEGATGSLDASALPLDLLEPFLPEELALEGALAARARARLPPGGEITAEARISSETGSLAYRLDPEETIRRGYDSLAIRLEADSALAAEIRLDLSEGGAVRGRLRMPLDLPPGERTLAGRLTAELRDRGLVGSINENLANTAGRVRIELRPAGTLSDPELAGTITLDSARADVLPAGIELRQVRFTAESGDGRTWSLSGQARSGEGRVTLDGSARLPTGERGWSAEGGLEGEAFEAYATTQARVIASPDLRIRAGPDSVRVTGEVRVPRASLTPRNLQEAVAVSEDAIIITTDSLPQRDPAVKLFAEVRVVLGDEVFIDAHGLAGRLEGNLVVVTEPNAPLLARGELSIIDGVYATYRQEFTIERGRLLFADTPIRNPGLDLRITRTVDDVIAGMNVVGTAREPQITLFSEPALPDQQVLAYLLLGRPLNGAVDPEEGEILQRAARSAGLAGGELLAAQVGEALGLEEARIERDDGREAALVLGTFLTPRLYVAYTIGIFDVGNLLRLRYSFGDAWVLQTETGFETGADLFYTLEP